VCEELENQRAGWPNMSNIYITLHTCIDSTGTGKLVPMNPVSALIFEKLTSIYLLWVVANEISTS